MFSTNNSYQPLAMSVLRKRKTWTMFRWTTSRRGEYDTQSLDRRLVRGGGGHIGGGGGHLGGGSGHLGGGSGHYGGGGGHIDGNHLSEHLTKHLGIKIYLQNLVSRHFCLDVM